MPLLKDICCGRGGASKGFMAAGFRAKGYDLVAQPDYPGRFILRDVLKMKAADLREADFVWASTPCQQFSIHTMPHFFPQPKFPELGLRLFDHVRNICEQSGRRYIMENVRGAERFVGRSANYCGPFYFWGNAVPAIFPAHLYKVRKGINVLSATQVRRCNGDRAKIRELRRQQPAWLPCATGERPEKYSAAVSAEIPFELSFYIASLQQSGEVRQTSAGNALAGVSSDRDSTPLCSAECLNGKEPAQGAGTASRSGGLRSEAEKSTVAGSV